MVQTPTSDQQIEQPVKAMQDRYPPRRRTPGGLAWALLGWLQKKRIEWEDRLGLFRYADWIRSVEAAQHKVVRRQAQDLPSRDISFDFVICGGEITAGALGNTLESLRQIKAEWALKVPLPDSAPVQVIPGLRDLNAREPRLEVVITRFDPLTATGSWLQLLPHLSADWVIPLRAGDTLSQVWYDAFRLYRNRYPQSNLFYWDEDQQAVAGGRERPFFKPGWSPELLYGNNFVESAAFSIDLLRSACDTLTPGAAGCLLEVVGKAQVPQRISLVLQHRAPLSAEMNEGLRINHAAEVRAALELLGLQDVAVKTHDSNANCLQVRWKIAPALVSIIIPTKNHPDYLKRCLSTLIDKTTGVPYEIILMDDYSDNLEVLAYYQEIQGLYENVRVVQNEGPFNYSRVNNQGARHARGDLLLFLNNDVEILDSGWLVEMVRWAQLPGVGMVGAKLLYSHGAVQHAGVVLGMTGHAGHIYAGQPPAQTELYLSPDCCRNVSAVTGACMLVRRDVFDQLGGFDEALILVFNDIELGLRFIQNGWRIVYTPSAVLIHHEGMSRSRYMPPGDIHLGAERLAAEIERGDCWYNPNLSLAVNWPSFRRPYETNASQRLRRIVKYKGTPSSLAKTSGV